MAPSFLPGGKICRFLCRMGAVRLLRAIAAYIKVQLSGRPRERVMALKEAPRRLSTTAR
jgi:hypothetical protein